VRKREGEGGRKRKREKERKREIGEEKERERGRERERKKEKERVREGERERGRVNDDVSLSNNQLICSRVFAGSKDGTSGSSRASKQQLGLHLQAKKACASVLLLLLSLLLGKIEYVMNC